ncbi:ribonuclease H-like domain-containing protein [Peziza echinospora]|nr:ribonuclease H-like domain-containing protein [Peziza echinospora]
MDPETSFKTFQDEAFAELMGTTKLSARLASEDLSFHRSLDPAFATSLNQCNASLLSAINSLLQNATLGTDLDAPKLGDPDDVDTHWKDVVEVVDFLLEKADTCLDEYTGAIKQKNPQPLPGARQNDPRKPIKTGPNMFRNRNLPKPQLTFRIPPNNYDNSPFKPLLSTKPHAIVPLKESTRSFIDEKLQVQHYHPYKTEIERLKYPSELFTSKPPIKYTPFDETKPIYVDTEDSLLEMLKDLKQAKEIAVDLEHHNDRSFVGFVCLMQISTRDKDWIVDTLKLREELQILNEVFADPNIVKVLHGAYMDIIWLQRDFGLYVVGLFDTHEAAKTLGFAGKGLAFLLKKYVDFDADKQYQLADWRIRPIPQEMLDYARSDTHFLLYCFDMMRNELVERSAPSVHLMEEVIASSKETALRRYERESYDFAAEGSGQLKRITSAFDPAQYAVFKAVHQWRDKVARDEDDSHNYVLQRHHIFNLARQMPEDIPSVLSACNPASPHVRLRASELIAVIKAAKAKAASELPRVPIVAINAEPIAIAPVQVEVRNEPIDIFTSDLSPSSIRSHESGFWGSAVGSSKWVAGSAQAVVDVRLAVPLPRLTAAIFINPEDSTAVAQQHPGQTSEPGSRAEHEFVRNRPAPQPADNGVIIVKQVGGGKKRKRDKVVEVESSTNPLDDQSNAVEVGDHGADAETPVIEQSGESTEKEDKKSKKKKKKAAKDALATAATTEPAEPFAPFDYSKAKSLTKTGKNDGKASRVFNPYQNPGEGPRRGKGKRKDKEGQSTTFKK